METVYRYRKHLREPLKYIGLFFLLLFLFVALYLFLAYRTGNSTQVCLRQSFLPSYFSS